MNQSIRSKKGFTLVEIMIVVVIIGLLAAMAIPAFQKVRQNAFTKAMVNDARQIAAGCQQYLMENPSLQTVVLTGYDTTTGIIANTSPLAPYVKTLAKGYTITGPYDGTVAQGTAAFTIAHPQVKVGGTLGAACSIDTEGHAISAMP